MDTQQATKIHLHQFINLLRRRWKLLATATAIAVGLAGSIGLVFPPRYAPTAEVIVDPPRAGGGIREPSMAGVLDDAAVQTHVAALLSQGHLRRVFDSLVAERGPGPKEIRHLLPAEEFTIDTFTKRINAFKDTHSRMIGITYTSTDPDFATAVANRSMELYLATLTERNVADRNDALRSLKKQIPLVRAEVVRADDALQTYRIKHGFSEESRADMVDQQLVDLNRQLAVARSDLAERQARPAALSTRQTSNRSELAEESTTLETRVRQLERRIAILQEAGSEVREPEGQLRELRREATSFAQLYDSLVQRQKAILDDANIQPDVRVLSSASVPALPSSLNPLLFIPPAIVLALIGSGLLAVLLEQLDRTFRTERDVTDALGISCIGGIPKLARRRKRRPHQFIPQDARYTEAIRSVAATLQFANTQKSPKTFLVTSSVPGEGKTTLAISFAVYAARIQRRVLLIDLSFRHPSVASELGGPAGGGILQVLQGQPLAELIRTAPDLGFDYLPMSRDSADPVTTLAGEGVPNLLRELEGRYDWVVIDSASLLSVTEARLLASMVDKVLFAIKWGSTPQEVVQNALELLRGCASGRHDLRDDITAVITQIDLKRHARYRYGDFSENLLRLKLDPT
jgi:polysaccharide biosynthesis transport protein